VTPHKQRILAGDEYIARIDEGGGTPSRAGGCDALTQSLKEAMHQCEALIVSDYALGCVCERTLNLVDHMRARRPVVVDTREMTSAARVHATVVTPNLDEACNATGHPVRTLASPTEFEELARSVRRVANSEAAAVTLGGVGVAVASADESAFIPAPLVGVRHTVGAGDSFTAGVALALAAGCELFDAVSLGVLAGSVSVSKPYTAVVTLPELIDTLKSVQFQPSRQACR
ncbi:MAG TPA: PfkB family carbohydrate kinase, partial [Candidatus Aquilonibacter sp.]|nr:PfkB family carbohydrate kinase [Candidatus Aquilonibacter sp.]